ncbi:uncharacterized protein DNG_04364 [Cephalotrichum gorgonifer]|uniref:Uncharacterized protein n=1 Tax=Cephalotrichum gorgonifer TaxID=2041049 RepID=A0AAE8MVY4_9PEZI|nr:uncharacterized protein DNG_04364 [Cephalotrichum gorgonifer]
MPVTVQTYNFEAKTWSPPKQGPFTSDNSEILRCADITEYNKCKEVLQCTTSKTPSPTPIVASPNGFLGGIIDAWKRHHDLVLRPEDFRFVIVSQLSFYINANSEALRSYFVTHKGKKELAVEQDGTTQSVEYSLFANMMTGKIKENTVAAVLFMGAMQQYFEYFFDCTSCGIPIITLLGGKLDWVKIQDRLPKLLLWGEQAAEMDGVTLDGVGYPRLYIDSYLIPAVSSVPVTVREFDEMGNIRKIIKTRMMAGICGFEPCELPHPHLPPVPTPSISNWITRVTGSGLRHRLGGLLKANRTEKAGSNGVKLVSFWWIYEVPSPEEDGK